MDIKMYYSILTESEKCTNEAEYLKGFCSEIDESSYCNVKKNYN